MANDGVVGEAIEATLMEKIGLELNNLYKTEVTVPIAGLTAEQASKYLEGKYKVLAADESQVRVYYSGNRCLVLKIDASENESARILIHNEYGMGPKKENAAEKFVKDQLKKAGDSALDTAKDAGKSFLGLGGDGASGVEGLKNSLGGAFKGIGDKFTGKANPDVKGQLNQLKAEFKAAKASGDPERILSACLKLEETGDSLGINALLAKLAKKGAQKKLKAKELESLPGICDEVIAELKAKAGVN